MFRMRSSGGRPTIESLTDPTAADLTVATYSATDGDGDDITWSLSGYSQSRFTLTENGGRRGCRPGLHRGAGL